MQDGRVKNLSLEQGHGVSLIKASRGTFDSIVPEVLDQQRSSSRTSYCQMAAFYATTIILVLSFLTTNVLAQTFQYSHGWTNGKRTLTDVNSRFSYLPASSWMKNVFDLQFDNLQSPPPSLSPSLLPAGTATTTMTTTTHCDIQRMRLFFQGNNNEAVTIIVNGGDGGGSSVGGGNGSGGNGNGGSSIGDSSGGSDGRGCWIENTSKRRLFRSVVCRPSFVLRHDGERQARKLRLRLREKHKAPSTFDFWVAKLHERSKGSEKDGQMDGRKWPSVVPISSMAHHPDVFLRVASFNFNRPLIWLFVGIFVLEIIGQNDDDDDDDDEDDKDEDEDEDDDGDDDDDNDDNDDNDDDDDDDDARSRISSSAITGSKRGHIRFKNLS
ncbi:pro-corazonin-like [Vespula maculifrons]|uniref:Pro-corazonin n=1 Tax=Vespula maculifrons TaxID=7453 RepID=A0ABD2B5X7_VESMC